MDSFGIVLADDHSMVRQGLKKIIEGVAGLEVVGEAGDGFELLRLLTKVAPQMVILDMSMPHLRGIEAIREMKSKYPGIKVLVLTMHKEYLHQALSMGVDGYLLKEDVERELFAAIDNIRQGRIHISPRLSRDQAGVSTPLPDPLSSRETEVMKLIAGGKSNREIADILSISIRTAESHRASIQKKLHLKSTAALVRYAVREGYV